jgi:hypothetical protein
MRGAERRRLNRNAIRENRGAFAVALLVAFVLIAVVAAACRAIDPPARSAISAVAAGLILYGAATWFDRRYIAVPPG